MKSLSCLVHSVLFAFVFIAGCKKNEVVPQSNFFGNQCRITRIIFNNRPYLASYDENNNLRGLGPGLNKEGQQYIFEFSGERLMKVDYVLSQNKPETIVQYEYGPFGLNLVRRFAFRPDLNNPLPMIERTRCEFAYDNEINKPVSLKVFSNNSDSTNFPDDFKLATTRNYEFDKSGNLVKETVFGVTDQGKTPFSYILKHLYDNHLNSGRPLYYMLYGGQDSGSYLFSENNKVATEKFMFGDSSKIRYNVKYDGNGQVVDDGFMFSGIKWKCE
ncbi:MAG: hypothetical protein ABIN80_17955 [Dyadobacter sp.]|uniref:hypothetical protein n=1 Tax=Dyadobacter sp. TaxID=1914288 RepID=UPI00326341D5